MSLSLSLIIPIYNEESLIYENTKRYYEELSRITTEFEILLVNDGSTDGSKKELKQIVKSYPRVRIFHHRKNLGVGEAIKTGFAHSQKEWMFVDPIDHPFEVSDIRRFIHEFKRCDILVVVRTDHSANSFFRKITSIVNYYLIRILFRIPIGDYQFIQFYKRSIIQRIWPVSTDTFVPPEMLIRASRRGFTIREVSAVFHKREKGYSKYYSFIRYWRTILEMLRFWYKLNTTYE